MKLEIVKCPACNGSLTVSREMDIVECAYCGSSVKVRDLLIVKSDVNIENLIDLGYMAIEQQNYFEGLDYMNRILELDINNVKAWFGKGLCCINGSGGEILKMNEGLNYVKKAYELGSDYDKNEIRKVFVDGLKRQELLGIHIDFLFNVFESFGSNEKSILVKIIKLSGSNLNNAILHNEQTLIKKYRNYLDDALNRLKEIDFDEYKIHLVRTKNDSYLAYGIMGNKVRNDNMSNFMKYLGKSIIPVVIVFIFVSYLLASTSKDLLGNVKVNEFIFIVSFIFLFAFYLIILWLMSDKK